MENECDHPRYFLMGVDIPAPKALIKTEWSYVESCQANLLDVQKQYSSTERHSIIYLSRYLSYVIKEKFMLLAAYLSSYDYTWEFEEH